MAKEPAKTRKPATPKSPRITRSEDTPDAQPTKAKAQAAAEEQFAEADATAAEGAEVKLRMAALGGY